MLEFRIKHDGTPKAIKNSRDNLIKYIDGRSGLKLSTKFVNGLFDLTRLSEEVYDKLIVTYLELPQKDFRGFHEAVKFYFYDSERDRHFTEPYQFDNNIKHVYMYYYYFIAGRSEVTLKNTRSAFNVLEEAEKQISKSLLDFTEKDINEAIKITAKLLNTERVRAKVQDIKRFMEWYRSSMVTTEDTDINSTAWNEFNASTKNITLATSQRHITRQELLDIIKSEGKFELQTTVMALCAFKGVAKTVHVTTSEISNLKKDDIDIANKAIHLNLVEGNQRDIEIKDDELKFFDELKHNDVGRKPFSKQLGTLSPTNYLFRNIHSNRGDSSAPLSYQLVARRLRELANKYVEKYDEYDFNYKTLAHDGQLYFITEWLDKNYDHSASEKDNIKDAATIAAFRFCLINEEQKEDALAHRETNEVTKVIQRLARNYTIEKELLNGSK